MANYNPFENPFMATMMDQQQKMYQAWADQFKAKDEPKTKSGSKAAAETTTPLDMYKDMLSNYQEWFSRMSSMTPSMDQFKFANGFMPDWSQMQKNFAGFTPDWTKMQEMYSGMMPNWDQMKDFYAKAMDWSQMQKSFTNFMPDWSQMQSFYNGMMPNWNQMNNAFAGMMPNWGQMANSFAGMVPNFESMQALFNSVPGFDIYQKVFEFWKGIQNPEDFVKNFGARYMDFMQELLKTTLPYGMNQFMTDPRQLMDSCVTFYRTIMSPWMDVDEELIERVLQGDPKAYVEFFHEINDKYDETFGKLFNMEGLGINREADEARLHAVNTYYKTMFAAAELLSVVQNGFYDGMKKLIARYKGAMEEGKEITTFREFYDLWFNVNEDTLLDLFNTDEFSKAFANFADMNSQFIIARNAVLEKYLSELPIPTKTDMDSLYKTVYDLRKDVFFMKKKMDAAAEESK